MNIAEIDRAAREHFERLTADEVRQVIHRMADIEGYSDHTIAAACRLAVEQVRVILGERRAAA